MTRCLTWSSVQTLETACTWEQFYSGIDVWVKRPNVINRRLLGAVVRLEKSLSSSRKVELGQATIGELIQALDSHQTGTSGKDSKVIVRELYPRSSHVSGGVEMVVIGTTLSCGLF